MIDDYPTTEDRSRYLTLTELHERLSVVEEKLKCMEAIEVWLNEKVFGTLQQLRGGLTHNENKLNEHIDKSKKPERQEPKFKGGIEIKSKG